MDGLLDAYLASVIRTLRSVACDIGSITANRDVVSSPSYHTFQSTARHILMELLVQIQDTDVGTAPGGTMGMAVGNPSLSFSQFPPSPVSLLPYFTPDTFGLNMPSYPTPVVPYPQATIPYPPLLTVAPSFTLPLSVPTLGQSPPPVMPFSPPGLEAARAHKKHVYENEYINGSDLELSESESAPARAKTPTYGYMEISFPNDPNGGDGTQKREATTPKRFSNFSTPPSLQLKTASTPTLRQPFSPIKRSSLPMEDQHASKARIEAKCKEAEQRRLSFLETRNSKLKKELDYVLAKTEQVRRQIEAENSLLHMQVIERQARAQHLRESQLSAVQESAKSSIQRVELASKRRAQCTEETVKSLKARYELIHSRREAFNKRIIEKALSSSTRYKDSGKDASPQLAPSCLSSVNTDMSYKCVETIWPPSTYTVTDDDTDFEDTGKEGLAVSTHSQDASDPLLHSIKKYGTVTVAWTELQKNAVRALEHMAKFYAVTTFPLREYTMKVLHRVEKTIATGHKPQETSEELDVRAWAQYVASWFGARYKAKDACSAESEFSDTITIIGHDHSEIHMYGYTILMSIAAVTPNYLYKCIAAAQEVLISLKSETYSAEEEKLLSNMSTLALFLASSYLRFSSIFHSQCYEHTEIKAIYTSTHIPVNEMTRCISKVPGICKEALVYSLLLVSVKILLSTNRDREETKLVLANFFSDGFILNGIAGRISIPIIPADALLVSTDSSNMGLAIVHDNFVTVQQGLRIVIEGFVTCSTERFIEYFGAALPNLCKATISCLSQLLLSSSSFMSHSKERRNYRPKVLTRRLSESMDLSELSASQTFSRQKAFEDYILAVDLQSIVAECFMVLTYMATRHPETLTDVLSADDILQLELSHSLSVLPLPGALFADEPSPYINAYVPYCTAFPRYHIISGGNQLSPPASYGVSAIHCTQNKEATLKLSVLQITSSPQVAFHANAYPFEALVRDCTYTSVSPALLCGLLFLRHALQINHKSVRQAVSFADEPLALRSAAAYLPIECFIDGFLRRKVLAPMFCAAKDYSSALSNDLPDDLADCDIGSDQVPAVSRVLDPFFRDKVQTGADYSLSMLLT